MPSERLFLGRATRRMVADVEGIGKQTALLTLARGISVFTWAMTEEDVQRSLDVIIRLAAEEAEV